MANRDALAGQIQQRLELLKKTDPKYAYDRDGRPGAIAAVRGALPLMERELFDAVVEDFECELAAYREVLFQMVE